MRPVEDPSPLARALRVALVVGAALAVFWPALRGGWIWDDWLDLPRNELLRDAGGLWKIWTEPTRLLDFYPLKTTVQWVQWQLWGEAPLGYHLTNLALHIASALLFWRVLGKLGLRLGWLGALLFAVHPLAVESVAWIAELKNTLSLPPLLLALDAFLDHAARGRRADYARALGWFVVTLLCKTAAAMLPVFLCVLLWWQRGRLRVGDLKVTAPFFVVSLVLGLVTLWFQHHRAIAGETIAVGDAAARLGLAGTALAFYAWKCIWPAHLAPIYGHWPVDSFSPSHLAPWLVLGGGLAWCWMRRATWGRHALLGLGWFLLHLAPFVGFVTISYFRFTWVMDHIAYVPLLGLIGLAVAAFEVALQRVPAPRQPLITAVAALALLLLALPARRHAAHFASEAAFWHHAVRENPNAWLAHYNLGVLARDAGRVPDAIVHFDAARQAKPDDAPIRLNLAHVLDAAGRLDEAEVQLREALRLDPGFADAQHNLGAVLRAAGRAGEARAAYERALALRPNYPEAHNSLALTLLDLGQIGPAKTALEAALKLKPDYAEAHSNLGGVLWQAGLGDEALIHYRQAAALMPDSAAIHANLSNLLRALGRNEEAARHEAAARRNDRP